MRLTILCVLLLVSVGVAAFTIDLSEEEKAACKNEGGCAWVTKAWFDAQMQEAFKAGKNSCKLGTSV